MSTTPSKRTNTIQAETIWYNGGEMEVIRDVEAVKRLVAENARQAEEIKRLREALGKAQQDINWMLNNRQFLSAHVFDYIGTALAPENPANT